MYLSELLGNSVNTLLSNAALIVSYGAPHDAWLIGEQLIVFGRLSSTLRLACGAGKSSSEDVIKGLQAGVSVTCTPCGPMGPHAPNAPHAAPCPITNIHYVHDLWSAAIALSTFVEQFAC